jgi:hypothetical protein
VALMTRYQAWPEARIKDADEMVAARNWCGGIWSLEQGRTWLAARWP